MLNVNLDDNFRSLRDEGQILVMKKDEHGKYVNGSQGIIIGPIIRKPLSAKLTIEIRQDVRQNKIEKLTSLLSADNKHLLFY